MSRHRKEKTKKINVLIVDDSLAMCQFLTRVLSSDPDIRVVGQALNPYEARDMIKLLRPDVLTLDVEMPRMDGITFLKNIMRLRPMPVVMLSSLTAAGAAVTMEALSIGAVDFLVKRHPRGETELKEYLSQIVSVVKSAATARLHRIDRPRKAATSNPNFGAWKNKFNKGSSSSETLSSIVAIGASTGGPEAIKELLENFYSSNCAVVLSQHMPKRFMCSFAERLNEISSFRITEAANDIPVLPGHGYVAPGDSHLEFRKIGEKVITVVSEKDKCNGHRPSVDIMFESLANTCPLASIGVLLTGMGIDGAMGMKSLHDSGALTIIQDESSSAVWGMPGTAANMKAADAELPLQEIGPTLQTLAGN